jgi:hypothetical protein
VTKLIIVVELIIVFLAAAAALFYSMYGELIPIAVVMSSTEALLMAVYLLVIGAIFVAVRPRRKVTPIPPPSLESPPAGAEP